MTTKKLNNKVIMIMIMIMAMIMIIIIVVIIVQILIAMQGRMVLNSVRIRVCSPLRLGLLMEKW